MNAHAESAVMFVSCSRSGAASAQSRTAAPPQAAAAAQAGAAETSQTQPRRREVMVNGRRVKTVDVHAHCAVPEAMALMALSTAKLLGLAA